jgi:predicted DNA-binding protein with PD1-like motif
MKVSEARQGRCFVIRLEDGDVLHESVESFAREQGIRAAAVIAVGGADAGSRLVVGPAEGRATPIVPMERRLDDVHEVAGVGTLFPDARGNPVLHMHMACGREGTTITGCVRRGVQVWHVLELVVWELVDTTATRQRDAATGFELLVP